MCDVHATAHLGMGNTLPMNLLITRAIEAAESSVRAELTAVMPCGHAKAEWVLNIVPSPTTSGVKINLGGYCRACALQAEAMNAMRELCAITAERRGAGWLTREGDEIARCIRGLELPNG